ncbi:dna topoisomerase i [Ceraceosorus bombacis]|uniref:DNA topoisomerase 1 n=1 Tax=Ceraceosorus bombacis TaxID=401625 RepID=A0A0P1B9D6_9BASI|nr:dna topoisomerase i [Ceraceosorus bombacis]
MAAPNAGSGSKVFYKRPVIKDSDSSDDESPLSKRPKVVTSNGQRPSIGASKGANGKRGSQSSDDDIPLASSSTSTKRPPPGSDSDSDAPLDGRSKPKHPALVKVIKQENGSSAPSSQASSASEQGDEDDDDEDEEEEEDDEEDDDDDDDGASASSQKTSKRGKSSQKGPEGKGAKKWSRLYHTGPRFPAPYEPLPSHIKLKYDGRPVGLKPAAEEAAFFYAVKLETQHARDAVFNKNFFADFCKLLKQHPPTDGTHIKSFDKLDFRDMYEHWRGIKDAEADAKKNKAPSERKMELEAKKAAEAAMKTCVVDGVEQRVGNVMVEPPALFLGRGEHPKKGRIKQRVLPEQITINHTLKDPAHPPPSPPAGHKWKAVKEDKKSTWLAFWKENINGQYKYMYLDAASKFKSNSDRDKFEKARALDKCIVKLRRQIDQRLTSKQRFERQLGTVVWLIDNYSLRAGNEKGEDEAATYGVCSLLVEHVKGLQEGVDLPDGTSTSQVKLEFLGKDSMAFKETLTVPTRIFKNFKMFTQSTRLPNGEVGLKAASDEIFDKVDPSAVNKFLQNESNGGMKGLSAKVFRTYNASTTFQGLLDQTAENLKEAGLQANPQTLRDQYNTANRLVAILCNHQKTVNPVMSEKTAARHEEKMIGVRYDRFKERQKLLTWGTAAEIKKAFPASEHPWAKKLKTILEAVDITTEQIKEHEERIFTVKKDRLQANFHRAELEREFQAKLKREGKSEAEAAAATAEKNKKAKGRKSKKLDDSEDEDDKANYGKFKTQAEVDAEKRSLDAELKELSRERSKNKSRLAADKINVTSVAKKILAKVAQAEKLEADFATRNKTSDVSLGTSKLNYIDPRITVAWLKKWDAILVKRDGDPKAIKKGAASPSKKGGRGSVKAKKEESDGEDVKPAKKAKGAVKSKPKGKALKEDEDDDDDRKPKKEAEKMELDLRIMSISNYFPQTMLKKFRWAQFDDDGTELPASWTFVENAPLKIRTNMSSANRDGDDAADSADGALAAKVSAQTSAARAKGASNGSAAKPASAKATPRSRTVSASKARVNSDSDDDDAPLAAKSKANTLREDDSSDDDAPLVARR